MIEFPIMTRDEFDDSTLFEIKSNESYKFLTIYLETKLGNRIFVGFADMLLKEKVSRTC